MTGTISALAVHGNRLIVAGLFSTAGGVPAANIAAYDGSAWQALGNGLHGGGLSVAALALFRGDLYAAGLFAQSGAVTCHGVARWDGASWRQLGPGLPAGSSGRCLAVWNNELVIGGSVGLPASNSIARWTGTEFLPLGHLQTLVPQLLTDWGGTLVAIASGSSGPMLWNGVTWEPVQGLTTSTSLYALGVYDNRLAVGGAFSPPPPPVGQPGPGPSIALFDGLSWRAFSGGLLNAPSSVAVHDGHLYAAGRFASSHGALLWNLARWNGSTWTNIGANGGVSSMTVFNGDLVAAGPFTEIGGAPITRIARYTGSAWLGMAGDTFAAQRLDVLDGVLYAFTSTQAARWNGAAWTLIGPPLTGGSISAAAVLDGALIVGGSFTSDGASSLLRIARWDGNAWQPMGDGFSGAVNALAMHGGELIAGGAFTASGPASMNRLARWTGSSWGAMGSGASAQVASLVEAGGVLYASGDFTTIGGVPAARIARWDGAGWAPLGAGLSQSARLRREADGLLAFGEFTVPIAGGVSPYIARWGCPPPPPCYANCDGSTGTPALNVNDFVCFQSRFAAADPYADCDHSASLNVLDFVCFQAAFAAGCQ